MDNGRRSIRTDHSQQLEGRQTFGSPFFTSGVGDVPAEYNGGPSEDNINSDQAKNWGIPEARSSGAGVPELNSFESSNQEPSSPELSDSESTMRGTNRVIVSGTELGVITPTAPYSASESTEHTVADLSNIHPQGDSVSGETLAAVSHLFDDHSRAFADDYGDFLAMREAYIKQIEGKQ